MQNLHELCAALSVRDAKTKDACLSFEVLLDSKSIDFGYNEAGQGPGLGTTGTQSGPRSLTGLIFSFRPQPAAGSPDNNSNLRVRAKVRAGMQRIRSLLPVISGVLVTTGWSFSRKKSNRELIFHN